MHLQSEATGIGVTWDSSLTCLGVDASGELGPKLGLWAGFYTWLLFVARVSSQHNVLVPIATFLENRWRLLAPLM